MYTTTLLQSAITADFTCGSRDPLQPRDVMQCLALVLHSRAPRTYVHVGMWDQHGRQQQAVCRFITKDVKTVLNDTLTAFLKRLSTLCLLLHS